MMIQNHISRLAILAVSAGLLVAVTGCGQLPSSTSAGPAAVSTANAQSILTALSTVQTKVDSTSGSLQTQSDLAPQALVTPADINGYRSFQTEVKTASGPYRISIKERYRDSNGLILFDTDLLSLLTKSREVEITYEEGTDHYTYSSAGVVKTLYTIDSQRDTITSVTATAEGTATYTSHDSGATLTISRLHAEGYGLNGESRCVTEFDWALPIDGTVYHGTLKIQKTTAHFRAAVEAAGSILSNSQKVGSIYVNPATGTLELALDDGTVVALK